MYIIKRIIKGRTGAPHIYYLKNFIGFGPLMARSLTGIREEAKVFPDRKAAQRARRPGDRITSAG